jgi:hypothetical protein
VAGAAPSLPDIIDSAELCERIGAPSDGGVDGLLILGINPTPCFVEKDVRERFSDDDELSFPFLPSQPVDAPDYWVAYEYAHGGATLTFGFTRAGRACMDFVVLNTIPRPYP